MSENAEKTLMHLRQCLLPGNTQDGIDLEVPSWLVREAVEALTALEQRVEQLETEGCGQCEACEDFFPLSLLSITDDGVALCPGDWDEALIATAELSEEEA